MIAFEHILGKVQIADFFRSLLPRYGKQPVEVVAAYRRFGRHRRHVLKPAQLTHRLLKGILRHAGGLNLLLQLVVFALLATAQFFLDRLDFFVEVILFLRALHLTLDAALDRAVHLQLLDFNVEHLGYASEPVNRIENL